MVKDPWKKLRSELCFGNTEPEAHLTTITKPLMDDWMGTECIPAISAGISYGKQETIAERCYTQNKNLIKLGHGVPLEAVTFGFFVTGISKAAGAQWSRHRVGTGHVSLSRRYTKQKPKLIYPLFDYIKDEVEVKKLYKQVSLFCEVALNHYGRLLNDDVKKQDARLFMPVNVSTTRHVWINARALRDFFRLRLAPDAEWEIRRLAFLLLDIVYKETPSLFEDIWTQYHPTQF